MSLLTPWSGFFLLIGVIPPLLILYFLKLRRRTLPISSTLLWMSSTEDLQANSPFQRLRRNLLLLLQLIVLLLLILAIMQPRMEGPRGAGGRTVLLIDRSGSMATTDGSSSGQTRLERALELARDAIDRLHPGGLFTSGDGETMVVAFGESAEIVQPFTDSRAQLIAAIERIEPSHGRSHLGEALQLARVYSINTDPDNPDVPEVVPAHLELFSDGRLVDLKDQVLRGETLTFHRMGTEAPANLSVLQLAADRPWESPSDIEVFAALGNFTSEARRVDVQLSVDGRVRSIQEVEIPASMEGLPGRRSLVFSPFQLARGAVIEVALLGQDALPIDDTAILVVPPPRELKVALVSENRQLLRRLLGGLGVAKLEFFTPAQWATYDQTTSWDVVVFDSVEPPPGVQAPMLTLGVAPPTKHLTVYGQQKESQVALQAMTSHPVMQNVDIDSLFVQESTSIQPSESVNILLEGSRTPLVMAWEEAGAPRVHVAFDPVQSTWPYEPPFVAFLYNTVDWLGHSNEALVQQQTSPGGMLTFQIGKAGSEATLVRPDGSTRTLLSDSEGVVTFGPVDLSGLHVLEVGDVDSSVLRRSVLFPSINESDIQPSSEITLGQESVAATSGAARGYVPLWPWAIGVALLVLMLEWWIWSNRVGGGRMRIRSQAVRAA
ncbi:MAG: BatA and WFA domain-containing protein [Planctomycetota bacterium]|nr:BatA and WFA domain-containing protein [Planctomycetota bacterium]